MFYDLSINNSEFTEYHKKITYSIIFSNEDSRVGIGLSDLMFSYGRTTDIEWIYEVNLDEQGNIISEIQNFFNIHRSIGTYPGGVHLEMTGQDVTECMGGLQKITDEDLKNRYHTYCDPNSST